MSPKMAQMVLRRAERRGDDGALTSADGVVQARVVARGDLVDELRPATAVWSAEEPAYTEGDRVVLVRRWRSRIGAL